MKYAPTLHGNDMEQKRKEIQDYFQYCYRRYESLFEIVSDESAYYQKADPLRHPIIFYYGHTAVFYINKLLFAKVIEERIDPDMESLFAVGVDEMRWDDLDQKHYQWYTKKEVHLYREKVYLLVLELIKKLPLELPITESSAWWVILMGIEHENIHLETSSVLIRQLPIKSVQIHTQWQRCPNSAEAPQNELIKVDGKNIKLGKDRGALFYGWDNEYGVHEAMIPDFKASKYLVSHGEFLSFVQDDGYFDDGYWCEEGKAWKAFTNASHPRFWIHNPQTKNGFLFRVLSEEIPLPMDWPVEVNCLEAEAFCRWLSKKKSITLTLPTEDEYACLRETSGVLSYKEWIAKGINVANINLESYRSCVPVDHYQHGEFFDVIGNVWQWTRTPIYPFEGFKVHPIYDDFSIPTFDGKHNLIKGGSWISCGNLATKKSRYAFRRHFYQYAGFRYIESHYQEKIITNSYTTDTTVAQYCHFGWGENRFGVENYPAKCASIVLEYMKNKKRGRALDVGCAIGRSSFELARGFDEVIGLDFSTRFIQEAERLKNNEILRYAIPTEGELEAYYEVQLRDFGLMDVAHKVTFWQADACNLKPLFSGFDLIFAGNLIDRLYDPLKFLESLSQRLDDNGMLILTSPCTWQEESTPKEKWIGGYRRDGETVSTLQGLEHILEQSFRLIDTQEIPFVIQETARKHQHTVAQMSVWEKKDV